jgi:hypothetical protein
MTEVHSTGASDGREYSATVPSMVASGHRDRASSSATPPTAPATAPAG